MKLLRKAGNLRTNSSEVLFFLFFRDHHDFGIKIGKGEIEDLFFLRTPTFGNPD